MKSVLLFIFAMGPSLAWSSGILSTTTGNIKYLTCFAGTQVSYEIIGPSILLPEKEINIYRINSNSSPIKYEISIGNNVVAACEAYRVSLINY